MSSPPSPQPEEPESWRKAAEVSAGNAGGRAQRAARAAARESWRVAPQTIGTIPYLRRLAGRFVLSAAVVALVGLLVWLLLSLKRDMPVVAFFARHYDPPLMPIRLAYEDAALLTRLSRSGDSLFRAPSIRLDELGAESALANADEILESLVSRLTAARPGGPDKNAVMIYLSMLGAIDTGGRACLIPPGLPAAETSLGDGRCLSVERLLTTARAAVPSQVGLVVVLDACHGGLQWPLGLTDGSFAPAVEAAVQAANLPRTWVLLPASVGQSSQSGSADGASVFARFLAAGLRGAADATGHGDRDGSVELGELIAYLAPRVDHWALARHGSRQTPVIYPPVDGPADGAGLKLARTENWDAELEIEAGLKNFTNRASATAPLVGSSAADAWEREHWRTAEALGRFAAYDRPLLWQRYQHLLLRVELLMDAGPGYARELRRTATLAERLEMELTSYYPSALRSGLGESGLAERLESEPMGGALPDSELLPMLRMGGAGRAGERGPLSQRAAAAREAVDTFMTAPPQPPPQPVMPPTSARDWSRRANIAWDWLSDSIATDPTIDRPLLGRWLGFVGPVPDSIPAEPVELVVARSLIRFGSDEAWQNAPRLPGLLLGSLAAVERSRYPRDPRADRIVAILESTAEAEQQRRLAFDLFFLGDALALERSETLLRAAAQRLDTARQVGEAISSLYAFSDQLLEEMPWLTAWWTAEARASRISALSAADGLKNQTVPLDLDWTGLIEALNRFTTLVGGLSDKARAAVGNTPGLLGQVRLETAAVEQAVQPLRTAFRAAADSLAASAPDSADTLARIRRLLATPLVRGELRSRLRARERDLTRRFSEGIPAAVGDAQPLPPTGIETVVAGWMSLRGLAVQPLVPVLTMTASALPAKPVRPQEFAAACGRQMSDILITINDLLRTAGEEALADPGPTALERADIASRAMAPASAERIDLYLSPHRRRLTNAWHDRLVDAATAALDDFWAGAPSDSGEGDTPAVPWCFRAARILLDKASETVAEARIDYGRQARQEVATRLAGLVPSRVELAEDVGFGTVDLQPRTIPVFRAEPGDLPLNTISFGPRVGVPAGLALAWFAESIRGLPLPIASLDGATPQSRLPLEVMPNAQPSQLSSWQIDSDALDAIGARSSDLRDGGRVLDLVVWYRGHRIVVAAPLAAASALRLTEWEPPQLPAPRVTVRGDLPRHQKVAVIFDCSGSMGQRIPDGRTRLEAGRMALYEVLEQIAIEGGWTASVWLYGHRTQWSRDRRGRYTAGLTPAGERDRDQKTAGGDGSFSLLPGNDVEQVLEPQPLVPLQVARIRGLVDALEPGGETPLYLAINEALRTDFAREDAGPGHVLVVTDGGNDQSGGRITSSADVLRTLASLNVRRRPADRVRIDVIGFDLLPGVFDRELRLQDLQCLARDSEGVYYDATDPRRLSAALRSSLQVARWGVEGRAPAAETVRIGEAIPLPSPVEGTGDTYDIYLDLAASPPRRRVTVRGGESVELFVGGRGRQLEFRRYDGGTEQGIRDAAAGLPDPAGPERSWFVAAHMARRKGAASIFPVSIQNGVADGFSPRPVELWAVLQPTGPDGPVGLPYVFFDLAFQPLRPVPVIDLVANDWPSRATAGEIRAWFRFTPADPEVAIPVNEFLPAIERRIPLANMPGSSLRVLVRPIESPTALRMTVIEDHPPSLAPLLPLVRVSVGPGCRRAVHLLAPGGSRVRHEFTLALLDGQLPPEVMLTATRSESVKRDAIGPTTIGGSPKPLVVPVPGH